MSRKRTYIPARFDRSLRHCTESRSTTSNHGMHFMRTPVPSLIKLSSRQMSLTSRNFIEITRSTGHEAEVYSTPLCKYLQVTNAGTNVLRLHGKQSIYAYGRASGELLA